MIKRLFLVIFLCVAAVSMIYAAKQSKPVDISLNEPAPFLVDM